MIQKRRKVFLFVAFFLYAVAATATSPQPIYLWTKNWTPETLIFLDLLFSATQNEYGNYKFVKAPEMEQGRAIVQLTQNQNLSLMWTATTIEREEKLLPVRVPVGKGLLGHRVCLIRKEEQYRFDNIANLEQWKQSGLTIGQGQHWPDTAILEANGLDVITSVKYKPLFTMLQKGRFDCFARSILEIRDEMAVSLNKGITIEKHLLFVYPMPEYLFVSRKNPQLAERLELGFQRIKASGQYDQFMERYRLWKARGLDLKNRTVIYLDNPDITEETRQQLKNSELWFDYRQL